jgi:hypothetical protein
MADETGPQTLSPLRARHIPEPLRRKEVSYAVTRDGPAFAQLLRDMQRHAGLSTRGMARKLGIEPNSITQYLYRKRGQGGSSTLRWFLRFAEACGCRVYLVFPSPDSVRHLERTPPKAPMVVGIGGPESACDP